MPEAHNSTVQWYVWREPDHKIDGTINNQLCFSCFSSLSRWDDMDNSETKHLAIGIWRQYTLGCLHSIIEKTSQSSGHSRTLSTDVPSWCAPLTK